MAQRLKHLPGMWETQVRSLGQEDPLEKETATHSSTLAWRIPWREEPGRLHSMGSQRVRHHWETSLSYKFKKSFLLKFCCLNDTWFHLNLTFLKPWANQCSFLMEMFFLSHVNETMYLLCKWSVQRNRGKIIDWERLEISSRKLEIPREHFMQRWAR